MDQAAYVIRDQLLRADAHINGQCLGAKEFVFDQVLIGANTRDLGRGMEQRVGNLAGHHIEFVGLGDRDNHVGIIGTGAAQYIRVGGVATHGADIEVFLQVAKQYGVGIDYSDIVGLTGKVLCQRCPHLSGTQNDDLHLRDTVVLALMRCNSL